MSFPRFPKSLLAAGTIAVLAILCLVLIPSAPITLPAAFVKNVSAPTLPEVQFLDPTEPPPTFQVDVPQPPAAQATVADHTSEAEIERRKRELRAALTGAANHPDSDERIAALTRLCHAWAEFDPRGAIDLAFDYQLDQAGRGILGNLTQQWATADLAAVRDWLSTQSPTPARAELVARVGFVWAQLEPEAAGHYVLEETPPGEAQTEAAISVLHQWAKRDRHAALAWAQSFPAGPLRERALNEANPPLLGTWPN